MGTPTTVSQDQLGQFVARLDAARTALVDRVIVEIAALPDYSNFLRTAESREQIRQPVVTLIDTYKDRLLGRYKEAEHVGLVHAASVERWARGIPAHGVVYTYQVASRTVWDWVTDLWDEDDPGRVLLGPVWDVWMRHVDRLTRAVVDAYVSTAEVEAVARSTTRASFVTDLVAGDIGAGELAPRLHELGYGSTRTFVALCVATSRSADGAPSADDGSSVESVRRELAERLIALNRGLPPAISNIRSALYVILPRPQADGPGIRQALAGLVSGIRARLAVTISAEHAWEEVGPTVFENLSVTAQSVRRGDIVCLEELTLLDHAAYRLGPAVRALAPVATQQLVLDAADRHPEWAETIRALIENNMSVRGAATDLHVHPNTVYYRIEQLRDRYGLDVMHVKTLMDLYLVLGVAHKFSDT
jgi:hypothetical protein